MIIKNSQTKDKLLIFTLHKIIDEKLILNDEKSNKNVNDLGQNKLRNLDV